MQTTYVRSKRYPGASGNYVLLARRVERLPNGKWLAHYPGGLTEMFDRMPIINRGGFCGAPDPDDEDACYARMQTAARANPRADDATMTHGEAVARMAVLRDFIARGNAALTREAAPTERTARIARAIRAAEREHEALRAFAQVNRPDDWLPG